MQTSYFPWHLLNSLESWQLWVERVKKQPHLSHSLILSRTPQNSLARRTSSQWKDEILSRLIFDSDSASYIARACVKQNGWISLSLQWYLIAKVILLEDCLKEMDSLFYNLQQSFCGEKKLGIFMYLNAPLFLFINCIFVIRFQDAEGSCFLPLRGLSRIINQCCKDYREPAFIVVVPPTSIIRKGSGSSGFLFYSLWPPNENHKLAQRQSRPQGSHSFPVIVYTYFVLECI